MDRVSVLTLLSAACILAGVLFVPPVIGLASNGDYAKVALRYNLYSPAEDHFAFAPQRHRFVPEKHWESEMLTSAHLPVLAALALHRLSGQADFDSRFLAAVYGSLFLLAFAILQPCLGGRRLLFNALALLLLADVAWIALFNSFYMDAAAFTGLLLSAAAWLRYRHSGQPLWLVLFTGAALFAALSKPQHLLLALPLAALAATRPAGRASAAIVVLGCLFGFRQLSPDYPPIPVFNTVFFAILPASNEPAKHLAELGFEPEWAIWIGTHTYSPNSRMDDPAFLGQVRQRCSQFRVARFLATHPAIAARLLIDRLNDAALIRPDNLGSYDRSAGFPPGRQSSAFSLASTAKAHVFHNRPLLLLAYILLLSGAGFALRRAEATALAAAALLAFTIGAFGDCLETTRHLTIFQILLDLLLLTLAWHTERTYAHPR